jgi:hypothetical protein
MTSIVDLSARPGGDFGDLLMAWADLDTRPQVRVLADLWILWANKSACAAFAKAGGITQHDGLLAMSAAVDTSTLAEFLRDAEVDGSYSCLRRKDGNGHFILKARRLTKHDGMMVIALVFHGAPAWIVCRLGPASRTLTNGPRPRARWLWPSSTARPPKASASGSESRLRLCAHPHFETHASSWESVRASRCFGG